MKVLIVLSLLCIAVNAFTETNNDVLVERLLKRYEAQQQRKRTLQTDCQNLVNDAFDRYVQYEDEAGYATSDLATMVTSCVASGSVANANARLIKCVEDAVAAEVAASAGTKRTQGTGNCAIAAEDLNDLISGNDASELILKDICEKKGSVHNTIQFFATCVDDSTVTP